MSSPKNVIELPYGEENIKINLGEIGVKQLITPHKIKIPVDIEKEIKMALNNPIGCGKIKDIIYNIANEKDKKTKEIDVVIITDDNTRLTPVDKILPHILKQLLKSGIKKENIKMVMALGTHRDMTEEEIINKVGQNIYGNYKVINHNYHDKKELVNLGVTENGTPIWVNKHVYNADLSIGIGSIVPHHIPGFSGGAKIVQPGICGSETTAATHLLSVRNRRSFLGFLENPVRKEMEDISRKVGVNYIFNTVLNRDGKVFKLIFGDVADAFREGVKAAREVYEVEVQARAKVTLAGSFPCNLEFWQAHKSLYPADMITEDDGMIILVTPCYEGVAVTHNEMLKFTSFSPGKIDKMARNDEIKDKVGAALAMAWSKINARVEVILVSEGINKKDTNALNFTYAGSVNKALEIARGKYGNRFKLNVLTHAPDTLPLLK